MMIKNRFLALPVLLAITLYLSAGHQAAKAEQKLLIQPHEAEQTDPVRQLIVRHLEAIKERNAEQAFSLITGNLHEQFNDAGKFLVNMRFEHRAIYNHEKYDFGDQSHGENGMISQKVSIEDRYGHTVTVIYRIKEAANKQLLIDSFTVLDDNARPI